MIIYLKNKHTLKVDDFKFRCSIGKNGKTKKKKRRRQKNSYRSIHICPIPKTAPKTRAIITLEYRIT